MTVLLRPLPAVMCSWRGLDGCSCSPLLLPCRFPDPSEVINPPVIGFNDVSFNYPGAHVFSIIQLDFSITRGRACTTTGRQNLCAVHISSQQMQLPMHVAAGLSAALSFC